MNLERDLLYMGEAYLEAKNNSDNPGTQTGAVIMHPTYGLIGVGANKFPLGIEFDESKLVKPEIYDWLDHAEEGAFRQAINGGYLFQIKDSTLYSPWISCSGCARDAIGYGIKEVVMHKELNEFDKKIREEKKGKDVSFEMPKIKNPSYELIEGKMFPRYDKIKIKGDGFNKKSDLKEWGQEAALEMFERKGIPYRFVEGKIFPDNFMIKFRGYDFSP